MKGATAAVSAAAILGAGVVYDSSNGDLDGAPKTEVVSSAPAGKQPDRIRFEELHHRADKSLRVALQLPDKTTNEQVVALVRDLRVSASDASAKAQQCSDQLKSTNTALEDYQRIKRGLLNGR